MSQVNVLPKASAPVWIKNWFFHIFHLYCPCTIYKWLGLQKKLGGVWVGCGCDKAIFSVCKRSGNYFNLFSTSVCCISGNSAESHVKTWGKWRRAPSYSGGTLSLTMSELLFKVIIIGDATVGKTSFVQRYVHSHPRREYKPTVGGKDCVYIFQPIVKLARWYA